MKVVKVHHNYVGVEVGVICIVRDGHFSNQQKKLGS